MWTNQISLNRQTGPQNCEYWSKQYLYFTNWQEHPEIVLATTTKPFPTRWGRLHGSDDVIMFYHKPYFGRIH
jgi:hypothetical protein